MNKMHPTIVIIAGILLTAVGSYLLYYGANMNSNKDKQEILSKIEATQDKLNSIKNNVTSEQSQEEIKNIENEFNSWAKSFDINKEKIKNKRVRVDIDLSDRELELSKKWHRMYDFTFRQLKNYLDAYNNTHTEKITYNLPEVPHNLYSKEIREWEGIVQFKPDFYWHFYIGGQRLGDEDNLPIISLYLSTKQDMYTDKLWPTNDSEIIVMFLLKDSTITVYKTNYIYRIKDFKDQYDLNNYQNPLDEIIRILIEYELSRW